MRGAQFLLEIRERRSRRVFSISLTYSASTPCSPAMAAINMVLLVIVMWLINFIYRKRDEWEQEDAAGYVDMACRDMQVKDWFHSFLVLLCCEKTKRKLFFLLYVASQREHSINIYHILSIWSYKILENEDAIIYRIVSYIEMDYKYNA
jgi:hypothetical protein